MIDSGSEIETSLGQPKNTDSPRSVTESGIEIEVNEVVEKAPLPILVTELGMIICRSEVHPEKALSPIWTTVFGIEISDSDTQPSKALESILDIDSGIVI